MQQAMILGFKRQYFPETQGGGVSLEILGNRFVRDGERVALRGVTYGTFRRRPDGTAFPDTDQLADDLQHMAAVGLNSVRLYTPPPPDLLELADELGLGLFVGIDEPDLRVDPPTTRSARIRQRDDGRRAIDELARRCQGHPSLTAVSVGNELPVDVVRLIGPGPVEALLEDRIAHLRNALPGVLSTYVNFPTTEFIELSDLDFVSFNVFLETPSAFRRYLSHLQVLARGKPVVLSELGLDSTSNGEEAQADALRWQLDALDEVGCAGAFVFSWTDEWAVADQPVEGWTFGLTTHDRRPKPARAVVERWCSPHSEPDRPGRRWPRVSVVVCAFNEERTIEQCLGAACKLDYPDYEVILCDDGSTDRTLELASQFPVTVLPLPHGGLSRARNAGWQRADGEIIAYLDADAYPAPDWLRQLVPSFDDADVAASGGMNLPVPGAGLVERAVASSPGAPLEVLRDAQRAEHVPGCTLAVRRSVLAEIGGFDPVYRAAGDDVDLCWRIEDRGYEIGFAPGAQIFHHRRGTVRGYLRQQRGYGIAERLLAHRHPSRFNRLGQARWTGFLYGDSRLLPRWLRPVAYTGWAGTAPFQPVAHRPAEQAALWLGTLLPLLGLIAVVLAGLSAMTAVPWWTGPLTATVPVLYGTGIALGSRAPQRDPDRSRLRLLIGVLHVLQPFVRTWGRMKPSPAPAAAPTRDTDVPVWAGDRLAWLRQLERTVAVGGGRARLGASGAGWDLAVRRWGLAESRITAAVLWGWEPRWRLRTCPRPLTLGAILLLALVGVVWSGWALAVAGLITSLTVIDWWRTRRLSSTAVLSTTAEARSATTD